MQATEKNHADGFSQWMDRQVAQVRESVISAMSSNGFVPYHTGGGCMAWMQNTESGFQLLITTDDVTLDGDPCMPEWVAGVHSEDGWIEVVRCTLQVATDIAQSLKIHANPLGNELFYETPEAYLLSVADHSVIINVLDWEQ